MSGRPKYTPDGRTLVETFFMPALESATRYDRTTGYFSAGVLMLASRGVEGLVRNGGRMRLVVGCTLGEAEVEAIERGQQLKALVQERLGAIPLQPPGDAERQALELLSWMVARGHLEMKVAIPCNAQRRPIAATVLFHEKAGVVEDKAGHRLGVQRQRERNSAGLERQLGELPRFHGLGRGQRSTTCRCRRGVVSEAMERQGATLPRHRHSRRGPRRLAAVSPPGWRNAIAAPGPSGSCS